MNGHPDNPRGAGQLATDAMTRWPPPTRTSRGPTTTSRTRATPTATATSHEPDGVIDHLVLVHAGKDKSRGGGAEGIYAVWAHSSAVAGGYPSPAPT